MWRRNSCSKWPQLLHGTWDLSPPTRDRNLRVPCIGRQILYHRTSREVPEGFLCKLCLAPQHEIMLSALSLGTSRMVQQLKNPPAMQGDTGDLGLIPGAGGTPGGGNGSPLQYSCLGNPMVRGAWRAAVQRVAELDTAECACLSFSVSQLSSLQPFLHSAGEATVCG